MLEGAIIGAIAGLIVSVIMLLKRKGARNKLVQTLREQGPDAARAWLDKKHPPLTKLTVGKLLDQRERMAALTLLGHTDALAGELAAHRGPLTCTVQVGALGLVGLALRSDPQQAALQLDQLATKMEQEGGRTMGLVKKKTRALATLCGCVASGDKIPSEVRMTLDSFNSDGGMVPLLLWQATAVALEKAGQHEQAEGLKAKVRQVTTAFDQPAQAA